MKTFTLRNLRFPARPEFSLAEETGRKLGLPASAFEIVRIVRQALDTRRRGHPVFDFTLQLSFSGEVPRHKDLTPLEMSPLRECAPIQAQDPHPFIIGMGPAGLFCALAMVENGLQPWLFDRGDALEQRADKVNDFWRHGSLDEEDEGNADRIRLVRRIFSVMGTLLSIQEQLINAKVIKVPRNQTFVQKMENILALSMAGPSEDYNLKDEISGWIRSWLTAWGDDCDFPSIPESFFSSLFSAFQASSSPVVLTNTCALLAMLIPYAPEALQLEFCVFLNNMLCTDPFDQDHLEILLAAVDGVTGIFDPQSKEWPAKPLNELKNDIKTASTRLQNASSETLNDLINERIRSLERIHRIL